MLRKNILIIWLALAAFVLVLYGILQAFLSANTLNLEREFAIRNMHRLQSALQAEFQSTNRGASDWAAWDEAYLYVQGENPAFANTYLVPVSYELLSVDIIIFADVTGRIIYNGRYDHNEGRVLPVPESLINRLSDLGLLAEPATSGRSAEGIVLIPENAVFVAARPVTDAQIKEPPRGTLIFGRIIERTEAEYLSTLIALDATLKRINSKDLPFDCRMIIDTLKETKRIEVRVIDDNTIAAYQLVDDISGEPALIASVRFPRTIYHHSQRLARYMLIAITVVSVAFGILATILIRWTSRREWELETHKREFYRSTIFAATEGKLIITSPREIRDIPGSTIGSWDVRKADDVTHVRGEVEREARAQGMSDTRSADFALCTGEAVTNAYKHAGGGRVLLRRLSDAFLLVVTDTGPGIEAIAFPELALKRGYTTAASMGVGYKLMISLVDRLYLATGSTGTSVALEMKIYPQETTALGEMPDTWGG